MLDRLISGAGAMTDLADRSARIFSRRGGADPLNHRPGSVAVAAILLVLAAILVIVGLEATDNPDPRTLGPDVGAGEGIGGRTYATIAGGVAGAWVETFTDMNGNDVKDADERSDSWMYFLVDPKTRAGVTVRSTRPPSEVFRLEMSGQVVEDAAYIDEDASYFADSLSELGITLDRRFLVDASLPAGPSPRRLDLATDLPADGTGVTVVGEQSGGWLPVCDGDADGDDICDDEEASTYDVIVYDAVAKRGVVVVMTESPEFTAATFTGMLRRDEHGVSEALTTEGLGFDDLNITVSDGFLLDDGRAPASAPVTFGIAALLGVVAGMIMIGLAGGYLAYRRGDGRLPAPATSMGIGDRIPLRITGLLRNDGGRIHVREAPADLVRFQTVATPETPIMVGPDGLAPAEPSSTLIIERRGRPEGVALGPGELTGLAAGSVFPLHGRRPALRAVAGTGPLLLSFDTEADRDRAAAELLAETGLERRDAPGPDPEPTTAPPAPPAAEPDQPPAPEA